MNKDDKGFTLVELIVVIVILSILAAILVPTLLGYIDRAKENEDLYKARNMLAATQAVLLEYYANDIKLPKENYETNANDAFSKKVRELADDNPYLTIVGVGTNEEYKNGFGESKHDQYTTYFVAYWEKKDKAPLFFDGLEWSMTYPWTGKTGESGKNNNFFTVNGRKINLSFIIVANNAPKKENIWTSLANAATKYLDDSSKRKK